MMKRRRVVEIYAKTTPVSKIEENHTRNLKLKCNNKQDLLIKNKVSSDGHQSKNRRMVMVRIW